MRYFRSLFRLIAVCVAVLSASCSLFRSPEHLSLTEPDSGRTFDLRVGDTILVAVPANRTAGYDWYPRHGAGDVMILAEKAERYEAGVSVSEDPAPGRGGTHYFAYRVIGPGVCGIALEYKRGLEDREEPLRVFEVMIRATGEPEEAASDPRDMPEDDAPVYMTDSKGNVTIRPDMP